MYKFLTKHGQTVALMLGLAIILIFIITVYSGFSNAPFDMSTDLNALDKEVKAGINFFNPTIMITTVLAAITAILAFFVFSIWDLIKFPKSAIKFLIGFAVLVVVFFILFSTADPVMPDSFEAKMQENNITDTISKFISAGVWTTIGLTGIAVLAMIAGEVRNAFK